MGGGVTKRVCVCVCVRVQPLKHANAFVFLSLVEWCENPCHVFFLSFLAMRMMGDASQTMVGQKPPFNGICSS